MFGYIRPIQGELKVYELERFKACYCGLCHALGKNYGTAARFILNYELVFLAMLLWDRDEPLSIKRRLCIASPCRKKRYCVKNEALDSCAGYSVILTWWKLRDTVADEKFIKAIPHRAAALVLSKAYRKAAREFPEFDSKVNEEIVAMSEYESGDEKSIDAAADKFAKILKAAVPDTMDSDKRRAMQELMYHTGRWIYILDAVDDYPDDARAGRYNAAAMRFQSGGEQLQEDAVARLRTTLSHSNNLVGAAFELLPENVWTQIINNIVYLGMPYARDQVLKGSWPPRRRKNGNGTDI